MKNYLLLALILIFGLPVFSLASDSLTAMDRLEKIITNSPKFNNCNFEISRSSLTFGNSEFGNRIPTLKFIIKRPEMDVHERLKIIEATIIDVKVDYSASYKSPNDNSLKISEVFILSEPSGYENMPTLYFLGHDGLGEVISFKKLKPNSSLDGKGPSYQNGYLECK